MHKVLWMTPRNSMAVTPSDDSIAELNRLGLAPTTHESCVSFAEALNLAPGYRAFVIYDGSN